MSDPQHPAGRHRAVPPPGVVWTVLDEWAAGADDARSEIRPPAEPAEAAEPAGPRRPSRVGAALLDRLPAGGQQVAIGLGRHWWLPVVIVVAALALAAGAVYRARPVLAGGPVAAGAPAVSVVAARPSTVPAVVVAPSIPASRVATARPVASVATSPAWVVVDVAGRVRRPGVIRLRPGSRVVDAIAAAGGVLRGVDLAPLNLAQPLSDGEQIRIGIDEPGLRSATPAAGSPSAPGSGGATTPAPGAVVDVNTADAEQLDTLPGIGPVLAARIVDWRDEHGPFASVEDLEQVPGIGPATLEKFRAQITAGP